MDSNVNVYTEITLVKLLALQRNENGNGVRDTLLTHDWDVIRSKEHPKLIVTSHEQVHQSKITRIKGNVC